MASEPRLEAQIALSRASNGSSFALDVELGFEPGLNLLFGPSGSGKSTILAVIAGLLRPARGRIALGGELLLDTEQRVDVSPNERRIALVFQSLALFPHLDGLSNVAYGLPRSRSRAERAERARDWLNRMRVGHLAARFPHSFSGGEAQRVALARALASEPRALLLDEPFSALDRELALELSHELREYVSALPLPVVLVTHDQKFALKLAVRSTLLRAGRVERSGAVAEVLADRDA